MNALYNWNSFFNSLTFWWFILMCSFCVFKSSKQQILSGYWVYIAKFWTIAYCSVVSVSWITINKQLIKVMLGKANFHNDLRAQLECWTMLPLVFSLADEVRRKWLVRWLPGSDYVGNSFTNRTWVLCLNLGLVIDKKYLIATFSTDKIYISEDFFSLFR